MTKIIDRWDETSSPNGMVEITFCVDPSADHLNVATRVLQERCKKKEKPFPRVTRVKSFLPEDVKEADQRLVKISFYEKK